VRVYTRRELVELLDLEEDFLVRLEEESIVEMDPAGRYSEEMLERARVAFELVEELEVNLPGVAVILRLREALARTRRQAFEIARALERDGSE